MWIYVNIVEIWVVVILSDNMIRRLARLSVRCKRDTSVVVMMAIAVVIVAIVVIIIIMNIWRHACRSIIINVVVVAVVATIWEISLFNSHNLCSTTSSSRWVLKVVRWLDKLLSSYWIHIIDRIGWLMSWFVNVWCEWFSSSSSSMLYHLVLMRRIPIVWCILVVIIWGYYFIVILVIDITHIVIIIIFPLSPKLARMMMVYFLIWKTTFKIMITR